MISKKHLKVQELLQYANCKITILNKNIPENRGIKEIDSEKYSWESWAKKSDFNYLTMTNWPGMYRWWCDVTKEHPLKSVEYGELSRNKEGLPQIEVMTTLQGGITFSKIFLFEYIALREGWQAQYGLDLHLDPKWKDFPKTKEVSLH